MFSLNVIAAAFLLVCYDCFSLRHERGIIFNKRIEEVISLSRERKSLCPLARFYNEIYCNVKKKPVEIFIKDPFLSAVSKERMSKIEFTYKVSLNMLVKSLVTFC